MYDHASKFFQLANQAPFESKNNVAMAQDLHSYIHTVAKKKRKFEHGVLANCSLEPQKIPCSHLKVGLLWLDQVVLEVLPPTKSKKLRVSTMAGSHKNHECLHVKKMYSKCK